MAIIRPRAIVVLPVGARLHGLSLLSFRLFPRRRTTYALAFVPPTSFYTRTSVFRFYGLDGSDSFTRPPVAAPQLFTYLRSHTRGGRCVCMRCRDIMLEKYELTTPGYTDSDDENEMRLSKVAASGGDRRVIHSAGIKNCPESEVDSMLLRKSSDSPFPLWPPSLL